MDTNDVELIELEVPIHEEESSQSEDPSFALSS